MLSQGSILIIDDKEEDGRPLSEQLKELCIPHLFFHADDEKIRAIVEDRPRHIQKVRVILQDINLTGGGSPGTKDYDIAVTAIEHLLPDGNGPWLLATWSTYAEDDGTPHAQLLFNHLVENLAPERRPFNFVTLDKSKFTGGDTHGEVTSYGDMEPDDKNLLGIEITTKVTSLPAMAALLEWESAVSQSVSDSIAELHKLCREPDSDSQLGKLLLTLSKAEAGKALDSSNARYALLSILNNQLLNKVTNYTAGELNLEKYSDIEGPENVARWKQEINSLLHVIKNDQGKGTGAIYSFESYRRAISQVNVEHPSVNDSVTPWNTHFSEEQIKKTCLDMVTGSSLRKPDKDELKAPIDKAEAIVIDITPPCDHAQTKALFRKFCGGIVIEMPVDLSNTKRRNIDDVIRRAEAFWGSCYFYLEENNGEGKSVFILLNSKLVFTSPDVAEVNDLLVNSAINKIGEQMTREVVHWLGSQMNRPGLTYL